MLTRHGIDLSILTETKNHGGSYEEEYEVSGTEYKLFFAGPENGERNHHGVALVVKAALWADWGSQWEPFSNRIITGWLKMAGRQSWWYAPTEDSDECVKDDFYDGI